jgi:hypothetical protein
METILAALLCPVGWSPSGKMGSSFNVQRVCIRALAARHRESEKGKTLAESV